MPVLLLLNRSRRADPHLEWRVRIFAVATVLVLAGLYLDDRWMTGAALALLGAAMLLRFLPAERRDDVDSEEDDGGSEA